MQSNQRESAFTPAEIAYLQSQTLGRIATVGANGQPHVVPVSFRYNPDTDTIDIGGTHGFATRKKWRDVAKNPHIAIVIDDVIPNPRSVHGIEIRGEAEQMMTGGQTIHPNFDAEMIRLTPTHIASWGIDTTPYGASQGRKVNSKP